LGFNKINQKYNFQINLENSENRELSQTVMVREVWLDQYLALSINLADTNMVWRIDFIKELVELKYGDLTLDLQQKILKNPRLSLHTVIKRVFIRLWLPWLESSFPSK
jgi:hypothetical protein